MAIYQVETDKGTYQVETEDAPQKPVKGAADAAKNEAFERSPNYPTAAMTDPSIDDALTVEGVAGLGKTAGNLAMKAVAPAVEGTAETLGKYAGRFGEDQMGKLHGTSQAQFRQLGRENFGDVMRSSFEHGDADLATGPIAREQAIKERIAQIGNDIGDVRGAAAEAPGAPMSGKEMADAIRKQVGADYAEGGPKFADANEFEKQLKNIESMPDPNIKDFAQRATDINTEAKGQKLIRSTGADTDIADHMSHINDEQIAKRLPPELDEHYKMLKEEFSNAKPLDPMELRGEAKQALGRGPDTVAGMTKEALHTVVGGPKMGANVGFGLEKGLGALAAKAKAAGSGGVTTIIQQALSTSPQSLGKYAIPLAKAAQSGGQQGIAAMHFVLSGQDPEYQKLWNQ